jgi:hypothetical protein
VNTIALLGYLVFGGVDPQATIASLVATRVDVPPAIDGHLDEPAWQQAPVFTELVQREPTEFASPTERTELRILFDDTRLYVGVRALDREADKIVARLGRRDQIMGSDAIYLCLDSFHDHRNAFVFGVDAAGTILDEVMTNDSMSDVDLSWDPVWERAASVDADGWTAEMAIPFSQLRFSPTTTEWGINLRRDVSRKSEIDYIVFTPRQHAAFVSRFPHLEGITGVPAPRLIELLPYVTLRAEVLEPAAGDPFHDHLTLEPNAGIDLKLGIASDLTLDVALNPDFGQVEVDPAVVNLTDVETFYEEKRPFFIEGANVYRFGKGGSISQMNLSWDGPQLFYTRRIGRRPQGALPDAQFTDTPEASRILGATKLTGKLADNLSIGTLHAITSQESAHVEVDGSQHRVAVEPYTYYGTLRLLSELNDGRQGIGVMATAVARDLSDPGLRDQLSRNALALGLDGWAYFDEDKAWVLSAWAAGSYVTGDRAFVTALQKDPQHYLQRPDFHALRLDPTRGSLEGYAGRLRLEKLAGSVRVYTALGLIDPGFEINDMGYLRRTDIVNGHAGIGYTWISPMSFLRDAVLLGVAGVTLNFDRHVTWAGLAGISDITFANFHFLELAYVCSPWETLNPRLTRGGPMTRDPAPSSVVSAYYQTDRRRSVVGTSVDEVDWSPSGSFVHFDALVEVRAFSGLSFGFGPAYEHTVDHTAWIGSFADPLAMNTGGARYAFGRLDQSTVFANIRVNYIFSPALSLQLYAQPFISHGAYRNYKELARPRTHDFTRYAASGGTVTSSADTVTIDPDGIGAAGAFSFGEPDFSIKSLRGNAVLRWEYLPGSALYLVWTQTRLRDDASEPFGLGRASRQVFDTTSDNIFMVKLSYWWTP